MVKAVAARGRTLPWCQSPQGACLPLSLQFLRELISSFSHSLAADLSQPVVDAGNTGNWLSDGGSHMYQDLVKGAIAKVKEVGQAHLATVPVKKELPPLGGWKWGVREGGDTELLSIL